MKKLKSLIFCKLLLIFIFSHPALAQEDNLPVSYRITYEVLEDGQTKVSLAGELYNPRQDVYVSDYTFFLGLADVEVLEASDSQGKIEPLLEQQDSFLKLTLNFNEKVVGLEKPLKFNLRFKTKSVARRLGSVWEIVVPKIDDFKNLRSLEVLVVVPNFLGPEIYIRPHPTFMEKKLTKRIYRFGKDTAATGAILSFGQFQFYRFNLKYNLKNPSLFKSLAKIALPPAIFGEQEVIFDEISPRPQNVEEDADGNFLASFNLDSGKTTVVKVSGRAKIFSPIRFLESSGSFSEIPEGLKLHYTLPQKYWETESPEIKKIVKDLVGEVSPQVSVAETALKLFNYVSQTLNYNQSRIKPDLTRWGALKVLKDKEGAVCMEFADLLLTLLRTAGIPSQLLEGFALSQDAKFRPTIGDVLHSWVRFYVPRLGWLTVDPTWANTTGGLDYFSRLDTNHFVFAIKGTSSETPYPAGAYKISPDQVGDIDVRVLSEAQDLDSNQSLISLSSKYSSWPGWLPFSPSRKLILEFKNLGQKTLFGLRLSLDDISTKNPKIYLGNLPPFGLVSVPLPVKEKLKSGSKLGQVSFLNFEGKVESQDFFYTPQKSQASPKKTAPFLLTFLGILLALVLWRYFQFGRGSKASPRQ